MKKRRRILITKRKTISLRVDEPPYIQALSCQKEKTISMLSALLALENC
jgi:hypothetical protein